MALRDFLEVKYVPLLALRPAEMKALQELPNSDKDLLLPSISIRPWRSSSSLDSSVAQISASYGARPVIVELGEEEAFSGRRRNVHDSLDLLRSPEDGYANWCNFIAENETYVPTLQFTSLANVDKQSECFADLERGVVVRLPEFAHGSAAEIAEILRKSIPDDDVCFIVDYHAQNRDFLNKQRDAISTAKSIFKVMPSANVCFSASSFPESLVGLQRQNVHERDFFNSTAPLIDSERIIYSDRGSTRAERITGGGGAVAPRIDYATHREWTFHRHHCEEGVDRFPFYQLAAAAVIDSPEWDPNLRLWGCQMIERTKAGDSTAINRPEAATAARINLHMHRQLFHDRPSEMYDTEDEWDDL